MQTIFERIALAASEAGLTVAEVGLNRTHVYRFKRPDATLSQHSAQKIAEATGCSIHWLMTGEGPMRAHESPIDVYPNRVRAEQAARALQFPEVAIARLRAIDPGTDRPLAWWIERIESLAAEVNGSSR